MVVGAVVPKLVRWVEREQDRLRRELLEFLQVDQEGRLLVDSEEEEEEVAGKEGEKVARGLQKGKEVACN